MVDVRDLNGQDCSERWVRLLKDSGAKVTTRTPSTDSRRKLTHLLWKNGKPSTLKYFKQLAQEEKPIAVGINWAVKCFQDCAWANEEDHLLEMGREALWSLCRQDGDAGVSAKPAAASLQRHKVCLDALDVVAKKLDEARREILQYAPIEPSPLQKV